MEMEKCTCSYCTSIYFGDHVVSKGCGCERCRRMFRRTTDEHREDVRRAGGRVAVQIMIAYENGDVYEAVGDDAFLIHQNWISGDVMNQIHGFGYSGPVMKKVER